MKLNFLEEDKKTKIHWRQIFLVVVSIILLIIPVFHYLYIYNQYNEVNKEIRYLDRRLQEIQSEKKEFLDLKQRINVLNVMSREIINARYYWDQVILEQGYVIPEKLTLDYLEIKNNLISMGGFAANNDHIIALINRMENSQFFSNVKIERVEKKEEVTFKLHAAINRKGG